MGVSNRTNCIPKKPNLSKSVRTSLTSLLTKMITVYLGLLALIALARPVESAIGDSEKKPMRDVFLNDPQFMEQEAARQAAQESAQEAAQEAAQESAPQRMESLTPESESSESASESVVA